MKSTKEKQCPKCERWTNNLQTHIFWMHQAKYSVLGLILGASACAESSGFRFRVATEHGKINVTECMKAPGFSEYLKKLNEVLKPHNQICSYVADPTTKSKTIECVTVNGPTEMFLYWAESEKECKFLRKTLKGEA